MKMFRLLKFLIASSLSLSICSCVAIPETIIIKFDGWSFDAVFYMDGTCEFSIDGIPTKQGVDYKRDSFIGYSNDEYPPTYYYSEVCEAREANTPSIWVSSMEKNINYDPLAFTSINFRENYKHVQIVKETTSYSISPIEGHRTKKMQREFEEAPEEWVNINASVFNPDYKHLDIHYLGGNLINAWCGYDLEVQSGDATFYSAEDRDKDGIEYRLTGIVKRVTSGC